MKIKCDYCGNFISDTDEKCPNCLAPNEHLKRTGNEVPQTIEELKKWYQEHNLPPEETTRFFIGKNIQEPRAFGIYKEDETGNYIVYKNKDSGDRSIRYEGKDEAYAVNELYLKLKEEILHQKSINIDNNSTPGYPKANNVPPSTRFKQDTSLGNHFKNGIIIMLVGIMSMAFIPIIFLRGIGNVYLFQGYYESNNSLYYLYSTTCSKLSTDSCEWYKYNETEGNWTRYNGKVTKTSYGGSSWTEDNKLYTKYNVQKQYYEEDWYKEMHPPTPSKGYYNYNNQLYYYYYGWYMYNNNTWEKTSNPSGDIVYNPDNYYDSTTTYDDTYNFKDTNYYSSHSYSSDSSDSSDYYNNDSSWSSSSNDSWDSSSSWDSSDSWDSGSTDWSSDW